MKRSDLNRYLRIGREFFESRGFPLPPFADFTPDEWPGHAAECREVIDLRLGWDVTAFGSGAFEKTGLLLFTLRNGMLRSERYLKPYAEKIMMVREGQITPCHFHWRKREDIINRGGGDLAMEVWTAGADGSLTDAPVRLSLDGRRRTFAPGETLTLRPGESVCFEPFHAHRFYAVPGTGPVLAGEVSMVNDDTNDNCFIAGQPRFDPIIEDEKPWRLLVSDYPAHLEQQP